MYKSTPILPFFSIVLTIGLTHIMDLQVSVRAVGLNFRDVLNVLGMYPGDAGAPGADCAGTVESVGLGVTGFRSGKSCVRPQGDTCQYSHLPRCDPCPHVTVPCLSVFSTGDAVFGLAPGCLGPSVIVPASLVVLMPQNLSYEEAATTPTVYVTVFVAFQQGEDIGPGKHVLIHAGTGGVGVAAVQVAQALGCRISSTAGSSAKRFQLRIAGLCTTADTRSVEFVDSLTIATQGHGVNVLLNSLTSPGMQC